MCHCTVYKLSALQVRLAEENKLNATTQQFITAKISGIVLNSGVKHTHNHKRPQKLFHGGPTSTFVYGFQVAGEAMQTDVHKTL